MEPHLVIFDDGLGQWGPVTDTRSILDVRSAGLTMRERIERVTGLDAQHLFVPAHLQNVTHTHAGQAANHTGSQSESDFASSSWLLVSARWLAVDHVQTVLGMSVDSALFDRHGALVAARTDDMNLASKLAQQRPKLDGIDIESIRKTFGLPGQFIIEILQGDVLIDRPWQMLNRLDVTLLDDIENSHIPKLDSDVNSVTISRQHPVHIDPTVKFHPCVVIDTTAGPVHIGAHTEIGAMSVIEGPCYIGDSCQITPHTRVRQWTAAGPCCVLGGEISRSIIQGYSNKAHAGYLGNSYVGAWVNLGADTNVSNLKNTYGHVRVALEHEGEAQDTQLMKQGPIIGDYTRTAIGSRLMTGSCIATATMLALSGFAPKSTRRFSFMTDAGEQRYEIERFLESARMAMLRREVQLDDALEARLRQLSSEAWN